MKPKELSEKQIEIEKSEMMKTIYDHEMWNKRTNIDARSIITFICLFFLIFCLLILLGY